MNLLAKKHKKKSWKQIAKEMRETHPIPSGRHTLTKEEYEEYQKIMTQEYLHLSMDWEII